MKAETVNDYRLRSTLLVERPCYCFDVKSRYAHRGRRVWLQAMFDVQKLSSQLEMISF
jgi:hypothetical protein